MGKFGIGDTSMVFHYIFYSQNGTAETTKLKLKEISNAIDSGIAIGKGIRRS